MIEYEEEAYYAQYVYNAVIEFLYFIIIYIQQNGKTYAKNLTSYIKFFKPEVKKFIELFEGKSSEEKLKNMLCISTPAFINSDDYLILSREYETFKKVIFKDIIISKAMDLIFKNVCQVKEICNNIQINNTFFFVDENILLSILTDSGYFYVHNHNCVALKQSHGILGFDVHILKVVIQYFQSYLQNTKKILFSHLKRHCPFMPFYGVRDVLQILCMMYHCKYFKCKNSSVQLRSKSENETHLKIKNSLHLDTLNLKQSSCTLDVGYLIHKEHGSSLKKWIGGIGVLNSNFGFIYCVVDFEDNQGVFLVYFNKKALKQISEIKDLDHYLNVLDIVEFDAEFFESAQKLNRYWKATKIKVIKAFFHNPKLKVNLKCSVGHVLDTLEPKNHESKICDASHKNTFQNDGLRNEDLENVYSCQHLKQFRSHDREHVSSKSFKSENTKSLGLKSCESSSNQDQLSTLITRPSNEKNLIHVSNINFESDTIVKEQLLETVRKNEKENQFCNNLENSFDVAEKILTDDLIESDSSKICFSEENCDQSSLNKSSANVPLIFISDETETKSSTVDLNLFTSDNSIQCIDENTSLISKSNKHNKQNSFHSNLIDFSTYDTGWSKNTNKQNVPHTIEKSLIFSNFWMPDFQYIFGTVSTITSTVGVASSVLKCMQLDVLFRFESIHPLNHEAIKPGQKVLLYIPYGTGRDSILAATFVYLLNTQQKKYIQHNSSTPDELVKHFFSIIYDVATYHSCYDRDSFAITKKISFKNCYFLTCLHRNFQFYRKPKRKRLICKSKSKIVNRKCQLMSFGTDHLAVKDSLEFNLFSQENIDTLHPSMCLRANKSLTSSCSSNCSFVTCDEYNEEIYNSCESLFSVHENSKVEENVTSVAVNGNIENGDNAVPNIVPSSLHFIDSFPVNIDDSLKFYDLKGKKDLLVESVKTTELNQFNQGCDIFKCNYPSSKNVSLKSLQVFKAKHRKKIPLSRNYYRCSKCLKPLIKTTAFISLITETCFVFNVNIRNCNVLLGFPKCSIPNEIKAVLKLNSVVKIIVIPHSILSLSHVLMIEL